jgi:aminoglycoside phosphotransferase (APT) family kinase protein
MTAPCLADGAGRYWNRADARVALQNAGLIQDQDSFEVWERQNRVAVPVPGDRLAWFPTNEDGLAQLLKERRILRLLERYCSFQAPRILYEDPTGWDLRTLIAGSVRPFELRERLQHDPQLARRFGEDLGRILADQHRSIPSTELQGWLPTKLNWPRVEDLPHLSSVVDDPRLLARIEVALEQGVGELQDGRPVLVHADLGPHNIVVDPVSQRVRGIFDYDGAVFGDRHQDFTYMVLHQHEEPVLDGAVAIYEATTGQPINRDRVRLLNAVAAIGYLAFRHGRAPEEEWCGRTLAQDLAWTLAALTCAGL